jgi:hypothetical protein
MPAHGASDSDYSARRAPVRRRSDPGPGRPGGAAAACRRRGVCSCLRVCLCVPVCVCARARSLARPWCGWVRPCCCRCVCSRARVRAACNVVRARAHLESSCGCAACPAPAWRTPCRLRAGGSPPRQRRTRAGRDGRLGVKPISLRKRPSSSPGPALSTGLRRSGAQCRSVPAPVGQGRPRWRPGRCRNRGAEIAALRAARHKRRGTSGDASYHYIISYPCIITIDDDT